MKYNICFRIAFLTGIILLSLNIQRLASQTFKIQGKNQRTGSVITLDGNWLIATDSLNKGKNQSWWKAPVPEARPIQVPWILQDVFPAYHGVVWYWRNFEVPLNNFPSGRTLLRFWSIDYVGDVWLNNTFVGRYESGEVPFVIDVTDVVRPGNQNHLSIRVLNPTNEPIDGMTLKQIPRQARVISFWAGAQFNCGGITGSVELLLVPEVRVEDLFVSANSPGDVVKIEANIRNSGTKRQHQHLALTVAPATSGEALKVLELECNVPPGDTLIHAQINIENPRLWDIDDPYLYRLSIRNTGEKDKTVEERSVRFGFRDFRFANGSFRLNGRRIFLKSAHSCNNYPIGQRLPVNPDQARRDMIDMKAMGFNTIRFIWGGAQPYQLDLCDEIGLMVYNESNASMAMDSSSMMIQRFERTQTGMILRDRNHPSVIAWGLLNETLDGPTFKHAVTMLPQLRKLDNTRMIFLNSGRSDDHPSIGSLSNPGSMVWEHLLGNESPTASDVKKPDPYPHIAHAYMEMGDYHLYPRVPQTLEATNLIRNLGKDTKPVFLSEFGIGSGVDFWRVTRHFERYGKEKNEDAQYYRERLVDFLKDFTWWKLDEIYARPEDFFAESITRSASNRSLSLTVIRSNPQICGYNLTGMNDQGLTGEGLTTTFRELKPGTTDALFEGLAPLRWCMFAEPRNIYRGRKVKLEVILANEDALPPGDYPALIQVVGPNNEQIYNHKTTITIAAIKNGIEPPLAMPVFTEELAIDGPAGKYHLLATLERGGAPTCGKVEFYVDDPALMPAVETEVTVWGADTLLTKWLAEQKIKTRPFNAAKQKSRETILVGAHPPVTKDTLSAFRDLMQHVARGSNVVFLSPEVFKRGNSSDGFLPLREKNSIYKHPSWLYLFDEWVKQHPVFEGLPAGGLMDHQFYREILPEYLWGKNKEAPGEIVAGAIKVSAGYGSGLFVAIYPFGSGKFTLNTFLIRNNLGTHPAAERLIRNLIRYAARDQNKSLEKLPADFDQQLRSINYK
jgi:hypothetical protein